MTDMLGARMAEEAIQSAGGTAWDDDCLSLRDRSLIVIELVEPVSRATLRRQLDAAGLDGAFLQLGLSQGGERTLNLVDVDQTGAKLDKLVKGLGKRAGPISSIGFYAVPLTLEELGVQAGQEAAQ